MPVTLVGALAVWAQTSGHLRFAVIMLVSFPCLLRPMEGRALAFDDLHIFDSDLILRYPGIDCICGIPLPKTRRMQSHASVQHVLIDDAALANYLRWVLEGIPARARSQRIWTRPLADFTELWHEALRQLRAFGPWTLAGLRGGGATDHYLRHRNVGELRRRGRWTQTATLDRYLQEGVLLLSELQQFDNRLLALSSLAGAIFALLSSPPPPLLSSIT